MKTTLELPEEVLVKAEMVAAERSMTFGDLVIQGLRLVSQMPTESEEQERKATLERLLGKMEGNNTEPMVPLQREEIYDR